MNKKIFLTSAVVFGLCCPAFAETFPQDGLMQENKTYDNAAAYGNLGVYEGTVDAEAQWEDILYQLAAGEYLPANSTTPTTCNQNGYFCPGNSNGVYYNQSSAQGLSQCPSGYGNTANGASANTDCYRSCTTSDLEHAISVSGKYYYGNNNQCIATECESGYSVEGGLKVVSVRYKNNSGPSSSNTTGLNNLEYEAVLATNVSVYGKSMCSATNGTAGDLGTPVNTAGGNCWCNIESYKTDNDENRVNTNSSSWVLAGVYQNGNMECSTPCPMICANYIKDSASSNTKRQLLSSDDTGLPVVFARCSGNIININWGATIDAYVVDAKTCIYGGDIRTPFNHTYGRPGRRFLGWKFQKSGN